MAWHLTNLSDAAERLQLVERVVADPLRFKARLEIGEGAYSSLIIRNKALEVWDVAGVALGGASVAKSAVVASTFFSTTGGFFGFFGAAAAVTPLGWVVAASVATGGAYYGVIRLMKGMGSDRVDVVPKFINAPLDTLAVGFFDLLAPLALKVAGADGQITEEEREVIRSYFMDDWGYDGTYVGAALELFEGASGDTTLTELTEGLRAFTLESRDCDHRKVRKKVVALLREVAEADGVVHELEELSLEKVGRCLSKDPWVRLPGFLRRGKSRGP